VSVVTRRLAPVAPVALLLVKVTVGTTAPGQKLNELKLQLP